MASQILLAVKLAPVVAVSRNADESDLSRAGAAIGRANGVNETGAAPVATRVTIVCLTAHEVSSVHRGKITVNEVVVASVEFESVGGAGGLVINLSLKFEMGFFVVGRVEGHDIGVAPDNHDVVVLVFELWVVLKSGAPVLGAALDLVKVSVDPEGTVEERRLAVAMHHDSGPSSLVPAVAIMATDESLATEDLVLCARDGCRMFSPTIATDSCDGEILMDDVCVRFENKANVLGALMNREGEVEFGVCVDSV